MDASSKVLPTSPVSPTSTQIAPAPQNAAPPRRAKPCFESDRPVLQRWIDFVNNLDALNLEAGHPWLSVKSEIERSLQDCLYWEGAQLIAIAISRVRERLKKNSSFTLIIAPKKSLQNMEATYSGKIGIRFFLKNDSFVRCRILDKTLGHEVEISREGVKGTYRLPDILIPEQDFFDPDLQSKSTLFLTQLIRSMTGQNITKQAILATCETMGEYDKHDPILQPTPAMITARNESVDEYQQVLRLFLRDSLIESNCSKEAIDHTLWEIRFHTLSPGEAFSFGRYTEKLYRAGVLTKEEWDSVEPIFAQIGGSKPSEEILQPAQLQCKTDFPSVEVLPIMPIPVEEFDLKPDSVKLNKYNFSPQNVSETLQLLTEVHRDCTQYMESGHYVLSIHIIDRAFAALPPLSSKFWDGIAQEDIAHFTTLIAQLTAHALNAGELETQENHTFRLILILDQAYALTIRMIQTIPNSYLQDLPIRDPFLFLKEIDRRKHISFQGEEATRFKDVRSFFAGLAPKESSEYGTIHWRLFYPSASNYRSDQYYTGCIEPRIYSNPNSVFTAGLMQHTDRYLNTGPNHPDFFEAHKKFWKRISENTDLDFSEASLRNLLLLHFWKDRNYLGMVFNSDIAFSVDQTRVTLNFGKRQERIIRGFLDLDARQSNIQDPGIEDARFKRGTEEGYREPYVENILQTRKLVDIETQQSPALLHELSRVNNAPAGLRIHAVISWCLTKPQYMDNPDVHAMLQSLLLNEALLQNTVQSEPQIVETLRTFIDKNLWRSSLLAEQWRCAAFWIRLGYCLETHFFQLDLDNTTERISYFIDKQEKLMQISSLDPSDFAILRVQRIFMMGHLSVHTLSQPEVQTLATLWVESIAFPSEKNTLDPWLAREAQSVCVKHVYQITEYLRSPQNCDQVFHCLQAFSFTSSGSWAGTYPCYYKGDISISLSSRELHRDGLLLGNLWSANFQENELLKTILGGMPPAFSKGNRLITADGQFECLISQNEMNIFRTISDGPLKGQYLLLDNERANHFFKSQVLIRNPHTVWTKWVDNKPCYPVVVFNDQRTPLALREEEQIFALNAKGEKTDRLLVNSDQLSADVRAYFEQIFPLDLVLFWATDSKIQQIDYPDTGLTFALKNDRFVCSAFPDYFLDHRQGIAMEGRRGAIGLIDREGHSKVLLPAFSHGSSFLLRNDKNQALYFLFEYDSEEAGLKPANCLAGLYLMYLKIHGRSYLEAFYYLLELNPLKRFDSDCWTVILAAVTNDDSPQANIFFLRLATLVAEDDIFYPSTNNEFKEKKQMFCQSIAKKYLLWTKQTTARSQHLPEQMKVTIEHQRAILKLLNKYQSKDFPYWNDQLDLHFNRIVKKQRLKIPATIAHINARPIWKDPIPKLHPPVRLGNSQQKPPPNAPIGPGSTPYFNSENFPKFYSEQRKPPSQRDFSITLQLASLEGCFGQDAIYLRILHEVGKNPAAFPNECAFYQDWIAINQTLSTLPEPHPILDLNPVVYPAIPQDEMARPVIAGKSPKLSQVDEWPLQGLFQLHFKENSIPNDFTAFPLKNRSQSPLEEKTRKGLESAHNKNRNKSVIQYELTTNYIKAKEAINNELQSTTNKIQKLRQEIENLFCSGSDFKRRQALSLKPKFHMQLLLPYYQTNRMKDLIEINPELSENQIQDLSTLLTTYLLESSRQHQLKEARHKFRDGSPQVIQDVGAVLAKRRHYDHKELPFLLVYEYASGKFLRPRQAEILKWIFETRDPGKLRQLLLEFEAGGGKTKVVAAILIFHLIQQGFLPIFFSIPELADITLADLSEALKFFQIKIVSLKVGLHENLDATELKTIYHNLQLWRREKRCLLMIPETYHSLWLKYRCALHAGDQQKVRWLGKILFEELQKHGVFLVDEGHRNADTLWQAIIATGKPESLPEDQQQLLIQVYDWLRQRPDLKLIENQQKAMPEPQRKALLAELCEHLLSHQMLAIPENQKDSMRSFWLDPLYNLESLPTFAPEKQQLICLVRGLIQVVLPTTLKTKLEMSYNFSLRPGDLTVSPRKNKRPSLAQYESIDMAAVLTVQLYNQKGLLLDHIAILVGELIAEYHKEQQNGLLSHENSVTRLFAEWQKNASHPPYTLDTVSAINPVHLTNLLGSIGKNPEVIDYFLLKHVLPQVAHFPSQFSSNYADFLSGGFESIVVSATLGLPEQYLVTDSQDPEDAHRDDLEFQAAVLAKAAEPKNRQIDWMDYCPPEKLFERILKKSKDAFNVIKGVINVGGWLAHISTEQWAREFLAFNQKHDLGFDGVIFLSEPEAVLEIPHAALMTKEGKVYQLEGSDLHASLEQLGLHLNKLKLFKIFGPSQTEATDLYLEPDAELLVLLTEEITTSSLVQGLMRARQFLTHNFDSKGQTVRWIAPTAMKKLVPKQEDGTITVESIFSYASRAQDNKQKEIITARSYLGAVSVVRSRVDDELKEFLDDPQKQIKIFEKHQKAFIKTSQRNTVELYGKPVQELEAGKVLKDAIATNLGAANLTSDFLTPSQNQKIANLVQQVEQLIPLLATNGSTKVQGEMTQHVENTTQQQQQNVGDIAQLGIAPTQLWKDEDYSHNKARLTQIFNSKDYRVSANELFGTGLFRDFSFYFKNAVRIGGNPPSDVLNAIYSLPPHEKERANENMRNRFDIGKEYLKPSLWYLIVQQDGKQLFASISSYDAENYRLQIPEAPNNMQVALISWTGSVICEKNFSDPFSEKWVHQEWLKFGVARGSNPRSNDLVQLILEEKSQGHEIESWEKFCTKAKEIHADGQGVEASLFKTVALANEIFCEHSRPAPVVVVPPAPIVEVAPPIAAKKVLPPPPAIESPTATSVPQPLKESPPVNSTAEPRREGSSKFWTGLAAFFGALLIGTTWFLGKYLRKNKQAR